MHQTLIYNFSDSFPYKIKDNRLWRKQMKKHVILIMLLLCFQLSFGQTKFHHILITNDDGIEDADRLLALAESVSNVADRVSIIVSAFDRSGTSNHATYGKYQSVLEITCEYHDHGKNITVYTIPANPADCVFLGLGGFFGDDVPDLVLAGINGGPNIGPEWFGSGTIGAVRTSAFLGVKAVAFSGFDDDDKRSFSLIPKWIEEFISSGIVEEIGKNNYLTVGFPEIPFEKIKGVKLVERRISYDRIDVFSFEKIYGEKPYNTGQKTIWTLEITGNPVDLDLKYDDSYLYEGYVIITPMSIDENDNTLMNKLKEKTHLIPNFNKE
jgi:5'-nucleotidase